MESIEVQSAISRKFIEEYLSNKEISKTIAKNPRYQSILWRLSHILLKKQINPFSEKANQLLEKFTHYKIQI